MGLSFLPEEIKGALSHLNVNLITEIRLRQGLPVIVCTNEKYRYLASFGLTERRENAIFCGEIASIINAATGGSIYSYAEQIKSGFITCDHGVRIGLAGEYVMSEKEVKAVAGITSINIRIPHDVEGCASYICKNLLGNSLHSLILFSKPGLGKTTKLRDTARFLSKKGINVLIFDERNEIAAMDSAGNGFYLGDNTDVMRAGNKLKAFASAIRAMKPDVIVTDELYGEEDFKAVSYATDCGISVVASSHIIDKRALKSLPFEFFVELKSLCGRPVIYDKNFDIVCRCGADDVDRGVSVGE